MNVTPVSGQGAVRPEGDRPLSVSELAARIESVVRQGLPQTIRVIGELSGAVQRTHWYFNAKDPNAVIACVMFASAARKGRIEPENGRAYVLTGRIEYYAKGGKVSLIVDRLEPVGEGALDLAFRKLCDELRALGWLDPERKRRLPAFPRRVAVVTSAGGAALQDVLDTMSRRCPAVGVLVADVRVQGDRAAEEVSCAIRAFGKGHARLGIDAIIVTRGGGSKEDLWSFNERVVAEAIVGSPVPVVAAIGHETDTTIAELVADERAATPTQAAMRLTPDRRELSRQVGAAASRLSLSTSRIIRHDRQRLAGAARHPFFRDPEWVLARARSQVREASSSLASGLARRVAQSRRTVEVLALRLERVAPGISIARGAASLSGATVRLRGLLARIVRESDLRLLAAERQLESVGPRSVLGRGFSWTRTADGRLVRSVGDVSKGDMLRTQVMDGQIASVVGERGVGDGDDLRERIALAPKVRGRSRLNDPSQLGLFPGAGGG
jgi:exodeoxyribonuclease VII large subunit